MRILVHIGFPVLALLPEFAGASSFRS